MDELIEISRPEELAPFNALDTLPPFDPGDLTRHLPDAHWVVARSGVIVGRCSLWWEDSPQYNNHRVGIIGHYAVQDAIAAQQILQHACEQLAQQGCTFAIGPMDGNTWRRYRFVTEPGNEPAFFLEPSNPEEWPQHWLHQGFAPIARYTSALNDDLGNVDPRLERVAQRMAAQSINIRPLNEDDFEAELQRIFAVSCISFRPNFLYTPIDEAEFVSMYSKMKSFVRPELVLLAMQDQQPVGFLFALPDWLQAQRGETINTVIIKTVAVLPGRAYAGLGNLLAAWCHSAARGLGYTHGIHALMHDANHSRNVSGHYAQTIRRYELFGKAL